MEGGRVMDEIIRDIFFLGLLGTGIARTLLFLGLEYTSPALVAAMSNLVPSITFILAVLCRMENVDIYKVSTQAKILGCLVAFGGAAMLALYKGIVVVSSHKDNFHHYENKRIIPHGDNWIKGSIFLLFAYFAMAAFYILQTLAIKKYPAPITLTLHTSFSGGLFAIIIAVIQVREPHSWRLSWNIALLGPIFNGANGVLLGLQTLGPFFYSEEEKFINGALKRLKRDCDKDLLDRLQISFDGHEELEKKYFLA